MSVLTRAYLDGLPTVELLDVFHGLPRLTEDWLLARDALVMRYLGTSAVMLMDSEGPMEPQAPVDPSRRKMTIEYEIGSIDLAHFGPVRLGLIDSVWYVAASAEADGRATTYVNLLALLAWLRRRRPDILTVGVL